MDNNAYEDFMNTIRMHAVDKSLVRQMYTGMDEGGGTTTVAVPAGTMSPDGVGQIRIPTSRVTPATDIAGNEIEGKFDVAFGKDDVLDVAFMDRLGNVQHGARSAKDIVSDWMSSQTKSQEQIYLFGLRTDDFRDMGDGRTEVRVKDPSSAPDPGTGVGYGRFAVPSENVFESPQGMGMNVYLGSRMDDIPSYEIMLGERTSDGAAVWQHVDMTAGAVKDQHEHVPEYKPVVYGKENLFEKDGASAPAFALEGVPDGLVAVDGDHADVTLVRAEGDFDRAVAVRLPSSMVQPGDNHTYGIVLPAGELTCSYEDEAGNMVSDKVSSAQLAEDWLQSEKDQERHRGSRVWLKGLDACQLEPFEAGTDAGGTKQLMRVTVPDPASSPADGAEAGYGRFLIGPDYIRMREDGKMDVFVGRDRDMVNGYEIRLGERTADHSDVWQQVDTYAGTVADNCAETQREFGTMMPDRAPQAEPDKAPAAGKYARMAVRAMGEKACGAEETKSGPEDDRSFV